ncbi:hypothetical protein Dalk_4549 [Desulfatibacillum aliphaticivorans]|uniref:Uncharacterized protein n=1 Tax=Desulfatibacillum aliphaticivorans TaxID=218208 RepID=B8FCR4_DESAL|nr:hypothetical protein [Desulfatibacillum aliphaticivorans]ACL06227.1 hypothetical protein Dalk_4549 [Desulfatibacillum aliphaticivorans]
MNGAFINPASPAGIQMQREMARRSGALGNANMGVPGGTQASYADIAQKYAGAEMAKAVEAKLMGDENAIRDRRLGLSEGQLALETQRMGLRQQMREQEIANARATLDANRKQGRTLSALGGVGLAVDAVNGWNSYKSAQRMDKIFSGIIETARQTKNANLAATAKMAEWLTQNTGSLPAQNQLSPLTMPVLGGR